MSLDRRQFLASAASGLFLPDCFSSARPEQRAPHSDFALASGLLYCDHGAAGPAPVVAVAAVREALEKKLRQPGEVWKLSYGAAEQGRVKWARTFGAEPDEWLSTANTTHAMHLVARAIPLRDGDRVLTSDLEHEGGLAGWKARQREGVQLDTVALEGLTTDDEILRAFERAMTPRTRVVSVSHIAFRTGARLPVAGLARLARAAGAYSVIDGAQAAGVGPVSLREIDCDAYALSFHKGGLAPLPGGALFLRKRVQSKIVLAEAQEGFSFYTGAAGLKDPFALIGASASLDFLTLRGLENVQSHIARLGARLRAGLGELGLRVVTPESPLGSPLMVVELPASHPAGEFAGTLGSAKLQVKKVPGGNRIRLSLHVHLSEADMQEVLLRIQRALKA